MKCNGTFIFKSVTKREGGEFINSNGEVIKYDPTYVILCDEISDEIRERKFKFPCTNETLYNALINLASYTKIRLDFEVIIYNNSCKLLPINLLGE